MIQKTNSSMRQLLIKRARCHQLTSRLKNNMEEIEQKTEKLAQSRCSSRSSRTYKQTKLNFSMEVRQKSPKIRLLQDIVDKLKSAKKELDKGCSVYAKDSMLDEQLFRTPQKQNQKKIKIEDEKSENIQQNSPTRKKSKLQALLKDIKKCNQESTKAVTTIKKDKLKTTQKNTVSTFPISMLKTQKTVKQEIGERLTEIVTLKEELRKAKQQNKLLNQIIQINQIAEGRSWNKDRQCIKCGCSCSRKLIHPKSFDRVNKKG